MADTASSDLAKGSQSHKVCLSSDWSLQLDSMKVESLVIAGQHTAVNTFPGLVHTARQAMGEGSAQRRDGNPQGSLAPKARLLTGAKS